MGPDDWLLLCRTVRFGDTDAAGVMHFARLLTWCHEAYEESLERFGLSAAEIFPTPSWPAPDLPAPDLPAADSAAADSAVTGLAATDWTAQPSVAPVTVALPIVHCSADFRRPLVCGDPLAIQLRPRRLDPGSFEVNYDFSRGGQAVANGLTRHLAIDSLSRRRCPLPPAIHRWLEASSLAGGIQPL